MFHDLEVEGREEISAAEGSARMSALGGVDHSDDVPANLGGDLGERRHEMDLASKLSINRVTGFIVGLGLSGHPIRQSGALGRGMVLECPSHQGSSCLCRN